MEVNKPCEKCKRTTPTKAQWDYDGPLHGDGNGCECDECAAMCWGDPIDCARAARGEPAVSRYTQEHVDALIAAAVDAEREACARALWDESKKRHEMSKATTFINDGYLREIESSTFRWAAQIVENPNIRARSKVSK